MILIPTYTWASREITYAFTLPNGKPMGYYYSDKGKFVFYRAIEEWDKYCYQAGLTLERVVI